jgi:hypothetical protein
MQCGSEDESGRERERERGIVGSIIYRWVQERRSSWRSGPGVGGIVNVGGEMSTVLRPYGEREREREREMRAKREIRLTLE